MVQTVVGFLGRKNSQVPQTHKYEELLRYTRSLLIVTSLKQRRDVKAYESLRSFHGALVWEPLNELMIDADVWRYAVRLKKYDPKCIFCHPDVLMYDPSTSLYYRGLCALPIKQAKIYFGAVEKLESGKPGPRLSPEKALRMACTYNAFICSIVKGSEKWTLENGHRTIIATMGITLDGSMRNRIGDVAENRIRTVVLECLADHELLVEPSLTKEDLCEEQPRECRLKHGIVMRFSSEPDISFLKETSKGSQLIAVVEIKGGTDPAGALERYGAAKKSFEEAKSRNSHCVNFLLSAVFTPELKRRIQADRLVDKDYDIIELLQDPRTRAHFLQELLHYTLRLT